MAKTVSITVHPSTAEADLLTVTDAMRQVLDFVEALERLEEAEGGPRKIVWRLAEAHTNSPPFTVTAEAFATDPTVSVALEAERITGQYHAGIVDLLAGRTPSWMSDEIAVPLKRALKRNVNGVGLTEIKVADQEPINVVPSQAKVAMAALEISDLLMLASTPDLRRSEYGAIEATVHSLTRWHDRRALQVTERLSEKRVVCILSNELADKLAPAHLWADAWSGPRLVISGLLHYSSDGLLTRIDADSVEELPWTDVPLSDLRDLDVLEGRTVTEHLRRLWGDDVG